MSFPLLVTVAMAVGPVAPVPTPGHPVALPTVFLENRFAVTPALEDGTRLVFYTDSGGGTDVVGDEAVAKLRLPTRKVTREGQTRLAAPWPGLSPQRSIPKPRAPDFLVVLPTREIALETDGDGVLGQPWFDGRTWTFDYPGKTLWWRADGDLPKVPAAHVIPLHFKTEKGKRANAFARMEIEVDGQKLPMLFDTGATLMLSPEAVTALRGGPALRGGAFITQRTFERWHKAHPDWRVIPNADARGKLPLIEVPRVEVAGYTVGPVWFAQRANRNFDEMMSSMMDAHVEGAFGGGGLRDFRVTVDYAGAKAAFERP